MAKRRRKPIIIGHTHEVAAIYPSFADHTRTMVSVKQLEGYARLAKALDAVHKKGKR